MTDEQKVPDYGTREYLLYEMARFRERMGAKSFWSDLETAGKTMYALLYLYVNTKDVTVLDEVAMRSLTNEYDRRLAYFCSVNPEHTAALVADYLEVMDGR